MKSPNSYIKVRQGATMAVFLHKIPANDGTIYTGSVLTVKRPLRPSLMRRTRRIGWRPFRRVLTAGTGGNGFTKKPGGIYELVCM